MDHVIAISQGLGLAAAAGLLSAAPLALAASAATQGWLQSPIGIADDAVTVAVCWALVAIELVADAVWPGAQAPSPKGKQVQCNRSPTQIPDDGAKGRVSVMTGSLGLERYMR